MRNIILTWFDDKDLSEQDVRKKNDEEYHSPAVAFDWHIRKASERATRVSLMSKNFSKLFAHHSSVYFGI